MRIKDGLVGGTFQSPAAFLYTAISSALLASTGIEGISWVLGYLGVATATGAGTSGLTALTLAHDAHKTAAAMTVADVAIHGASHFDLGLEPETEFEWAPWSDPVGCTP
jgi:hypothetical protein